MTTAYALAMFDPHGSYNMGLLNPDTQLMKEGKNGIEVVPVSLNSYQKYLWYDIYLPGIEQTVKIVGSSPLVVLQGGDLLQGNKYTDQVMETSEYNQMLIGFGIMAPLVTLDCTRVVRFAAGTGAHEFTAHSAPLLVADRLRANYPDKDIKACYQGEADVLGYTIDYAHHGPGESLRMWLNGNAARFYLTSLMQQRLAYDAKVPDLVLRGHIHGAVDESVVQGHYKSRIIVVPSMCGMSFYARKTSRSAWLIRNGFWLFEIADGKLTNEWSFIKEHNLTTREEFTAERLNICSQT